VKDIAVAGIACLSDLMKPTKRKAVDANGPVFPSPIEEKEGLKEYD
jgi:hypothetical protein